MSARQTLHLVIRRRSRKLGEPLRRGIDGERLRLDLRPEDLRLLELELDEEEDEERDAERLRLLVSRRGAPPRLELLRARLRERLELLLEELLLEELW